MAVEIGGGNRVVSKKPVVKTSVKAPIKTPGTKPSPQKNAVQKPYTNPGVERRIADLSNKAPKYIVPYTPSQDSVGSVKYNPWLGARGKYGDVLTQSEWANLTPELKNKYNMGYTVIPESNQPSYGGPAASSGYVRRSYGSRTGSGPVAPPIPEMKIRSQPGIRRSPYWESEDPYNQVFEPRFVVLGNANAW